MSARMGGGEGFFEIGDAFDLAGAQVLHRQRVGHRHGREPGAQCLRFGEPFGQGFRTVERKDSAGTGLQVAFVAEDGSDPGAFDWIKAGKFSA